MSILSGVRARTLRVQSEAIPQHLGAPALEIWRIDGRELLNGLFEYVVDLRTPDALNLNAAGAANYMPAMAGVNSTRSALGSATF